MSFVHMVLLAAEYPKLNRVIWNAYYLDQLATMMKVPRK